ncbi:5-hydroxytryptamine receptor 3A-like [Crassostrea virginica]
MQSEEGSYNAQRYLLTRVLQNYSKDIRPVSNHMDPIEVSINVMPKALINYDERNGVLSMFLALELSWTDEILKWDPSINHNISFLRIPSTQVWRPRLFCSNAIDNIAMDKATSDNVLYDYTGSAIFLMGLQSSTLCPPNSMYFPFDIQVCNIDVISSLSFYEETFIANAVIYDVFEQNPLWDLLNIRISIVKIKGGQVSIFRIIVKLQRRYAFFMVTIFSPIVFLAIVNLFVFVIPVDSGERVSYAITVLLSFTVFLSLVTDNTPKSSLTISLFSVYMFTVLLYSFLITLSVVVILDIHFSNKDQAPKWNLSKMVVWGLKKQRSKIQRSFITVLPKTDDTEYAEKITKTDDIDIDYKMISLELDKFFIRFYSLLFTLITVTFMTVIALNEYDSA